MTDAKGIQYGLSYVFVLLFQRLYCLCYQRLGRFRRSSDFNPSFIVFLPNSVITPGLLPVSLILNARMVWKNRMHFSSKVVLPVSAFVLLGIIPGTRLLRYGSPMKLKLLLGLVIVGLGIEMLTRKAVPQGKPNVIVRSAVSFLSERWSSEV